MRKENDITSFFSISLLSIIHSPSFIAFTIPEPQKPHIDKFSLYSFIQSFNGSSHSDHPLRSSQTTLFFVLHCKPVIGFVSIWSKPGGLVLRVVLLTIAVMIIVADHDSFTESEREMNSKQRGPLTLSIPSCLRSFLSLALSPSPSLV